MIVCVAKRPFLNRAFRISRPGIETLQAAKSATPTDDPIGVFWCAGTGGLRIRTDQCLLPDSLLVLPLYVSIISRQTAIARVSRSDNDPAFSIT